MFRVTHKSILSTGARSLAGSAAFSSSAVSGSGKTIYAIHPPMGKHDKAEAVAYEFKTEKAYEQFMNRHKAELKCDASEKAALSLSELQDGQVYRFVGPFYSAVQNDQVRRKVDDKVLEMEAALAVQKALGGSAHIHTNVVYFHEGTKKPALEIDAIIHDGSSSSAGPTVYVVESAYSPQPSEVQVVLEKIQRLRPFLEQDDHFRGVKQIIPVLAGRLWPKDTIDACGSMVRVSPSAGGYAVHGVPIIPA